MVVNPTQVKQNVREMEKSVRTRGSLLSLTTYAMQASKPKAIVTNEIHLN